MTFILLIMNLHLFIFSELKSLIKGFSLTKHGSYLFSCLGEHRHGQFWDWQEQNLYFPLPLSEITSFLIYIFILCNLHFLAILYKNSQLYVEFRYSLIILAFLWYNYRLFTILNVEKVTASGELCLEKQKYILWTTFDWLSDCFTLPQKNI